MRGAAVFQVTTGTAPRGIKARRYLGCSNLDSAAQTCTLTVFNSPYPSQGQAIDIAAKLGSSADGRTTVSQLPADGVELSEGALSFTYDTPPTGNGIAIYFEPLTGCAD